MNIFQRIKRWFQRLFRKKTTITHHHYAEDHCYYYTIDREYHRITAPTKKRTSSVLQGLAFLQILKKKQQEEKKNKKE